MTTTRRGFGAWISVLAMCAMGGCSGAGLSGGASATTPGALAAPPRDARPVDEEAVAAAVNGTADDGIERARIPVAGTTPTRGATDALVTIVEFADFQCPFCIRVDATLREILHRYPTQVRIAWIDYPLPFHEFAPGAAHAAMEAQRQGGDRMFWRMHDLMMDNRDSLARADLQNYAQQLGLDLRAFNAALDHGTHAAALTRAMDLARSFDVTGTPAFFINGRSLVGAQPIERFTALIDDEIARAQRVVAAGVAPADVYAAFMRHASDSPVGEARGGDDDEAPSPTIAAPDASAVYAIPVGNSPVRGRNDALVTIVEVGDFQCPFCARVQATLEQVRSHYGNDVRFVWRNNPLPFHPNAEPAAQFAMEANAQGKFWQAHDLLFQNSQHLERADLERYAHQLHLNERAIANAIDTHEFQQAIEADSALVIGLGARGTPAFFVNGRFLSGAQPYEAFAALIDEELAKARDRVAHGTPRATLYDAIIADGATSARTVQVPRPSPRAAPSPGPDVVLNIPVPANAPRRGNAHARVVIQMFSDFQCPFCGRVEPTITQLLAERGNDIALIWRNYPLPFHQNAMPAAEAALEVQAQGGDTKFWQFHDLLIQNQTALERADLERYAAQVGGINMARFRRALDRHTHQPAVEADMHIVESLRIGTPSFLVNGRMVQGAQPIEVFRAAVDRAIAELPPQP